MDKEIVPFRQIFELQQCYLHQNGVEFEEELNTSFWPMGEILSLWPRFSFDSYYRPDHPGNYPDHTCDYSDHPCHHSDLPFFGF